MKRRLRRFRKRWACRLQGHIMPHEVYDIHDKVAGVRWDECIRCGKPQY